MTRLARLAATGGIALGALAVAPVAVRAQDAAAVPEPTYNVLAFDVSGNTILDAATIERTIYPGLGPDRTVADIEKTRAALEGVYRARGYEGVSVAIAGAEGDNIVKLAVVETRIGKLEVTGARYFSERAILEQVPALRLGEVPNLAAAQAQLARLDRVADRRITPKITSGKVPGTIEVELAVDETLPYHASVAFTNDHSPNTSDTRLSFNARATNLWQAGHTLSLTYLLAPERRADAEVFAGSYLAPIAGSPWSLLLFGYKSNSDVALLGGANVLGNGYAIGVRGILALPSFGSFSNSANFGFDYKDFDEATTVGDQSIPSPIRYVPIAATYAIQRVGATTTANASIGATAGVRAFNERIVPLGGGDSEAIFFNKRTGARENFVHVNVDGDYTATLKGDIQLTARFTAQYANGPLIPNEQFSIGGLSSVRGYLQSEAVVDDGVSGTFEVRSPSIDGVFGKIVQELRAYAFFDGGYGRARQVSRDADTGLATEQAEYGLASVGVGARLQLLRFLSGDVVFGIPLTDVQEARFRSPAYTTSGDSSVFFNVKGEF